MEAGSGRAGKNCVRGKIGYGRRKKRGQGGVKNWVREAGGRGKWKGGVGGREVGALCLPTRRRSDKLDGLRRNDHRVRKLHTG